MYRVASASQYLVITGFGIDDIKIAKKGWVLPWQSYSIFDISPVNYTLNVQAMSAENLPLVIPVVFIIGPRYENMDSLHKYAKLTSPHHKLSCHVNELVKEIIEEETSVLAASMTVEGLYKGRKDFKEKLWEKVQLELNQFGLWIYNANVKQLVTSKFSYSDQKTRMEAADQAKIDVFEAKMKGELGSKLREWQTLQNAANIDAQMKIISTQRKKVEMEVAHANAKLAIQKAKLTKDLQVAMVEAKKAVVLRVVEAKKAVVLRVAELQNELIMNALSQTEKLKVELLSKASVEYETKEREKRAKKKMQASAPAPEPEEASIEVAAPEEAPEPEKAEENVKIEPKVSATRRRVGDKGPESISKVIFKRKKSANHMYYYYAAAVATAIVALLAGIGYHIYA